MGGCFLGVFECAGILYERSNAPKHYEAEQCTEALRMSESTIEEVHPNIVGGKCFKNSFVQNIVSINALWVWWKCEVAYFTICKYDFKDILVIYYSYYIAFFPCP